jgi:hypothetical protein
MCIGQVDKPENAMEGPEKAGLLLSLQSNGHVLGFCVASTSS